MSKKQNAWTILFQQRSGINVESQYFSRQLLHQRINIFSYFHVFQEEEMCIWSSVLTKGKINVCLKCFVCTSWLPSPLQKVYTEQFARSFLCHLVSSLLDFDPLFQTVVTVQPLYVSFSRCSSFHSIFLPPSSDLIGFLRPCPRGFIRGKELSLFCKEVDSVLLWCSVAWISKHA